MENESRGISKLFKYAPTDKIWWATDYDHLNSYLFSFDKKRIFNLYRDYPHELTPEQVELFDKENPELAELVSHKKKNI